MMLLNLNTGYVETKSDLCIRIKSIRYIATGKHIPLCEKNDFLDMENSFETPVYIQALETRRFQFHSTERKHPTLRFP